MATKLRVTNQTRRENCLELGQRWNSVSKGLREGVAPSTLRLLLRSARSRRVGVSKQDRHPPKQTKTVCSFFCHKCETPNAPRAFSSCPALIYTTFYFSLRINPRVRPCPYSHFADEVSEGPENWSDLGKFPRAVHGRARM